MNSDFFHVTHDFCSGEEFPWIQSIVAGQAIAEECPTCKGIDTAIPGDVEVLCEHGQGTKWPDVLGCGAYPLLVVSQRTLEEWKADGIGDVPAHRVVIAEPWPMGLEGNTPPDYYWLDGKMMMGAMLDFEASGYCGVWFCARCGGRHDDVNRTYDRHHTDTFGHVMVAGTWNGANLFTTDLSPNYFFCTQRVVDCARRHRLTNFEFIPASRSASSHEGIEYM